MHICKRYTDPRVNAANPEGDVIGYDGKLYVFLGVSRAGSGIYRPEDEVAEAEAHGFHVWRKGAHDVDAVQGKRQFKKELIPVGIVEEADDEKKDLAYRMLMSFYPLNASHRVWLEGEGWRDVFSITACYVHFQLTTGWNITTRKHHLMFWRRMTSHQGAAYVQPLLMSWVRMRCLVFPAFI